MLSQQLYNVCMPLQTGIVKRSAVLPISWVSINPVTEVKGRGRVRVWMIVVYQDANLPLNVQQSTDKAGGTLDGC